MMSHKELVALLDKSLEQAVRAAKWLNRSKQICDRIDLDSALTEKDLDDLESLAGRSDLQL